MSLEPEYERLHRKFHAQLREIYRKNGGLPVVGMEEFRAAALLHDLQITMSYGYETEKKAIVIPESQGKTLQETVDDAIGKAQQGTPMTITFAGAYAKIPSLLQGVKEIEPPDGVHVLQVLRVGREAKDKYLERLREAYSGEYVNSDEFGARQDGILKAETKEQLERLVKDLPPYSPVKTEKLPEKKERAWTAIVPVLAVLYGCYYSLIHGSYSGLAVSLVIAGVFVILLCLGVAKGKSSETP